MTWLFQSCLPPLLGLSLFAASFLGCHGFLGAVPPADEQSLSKIGLPSDPVLLVDKLRQASHLAARPKELRQVVEQLGSASFCEREEAQRTLLLVGPAALSLLRGLRDSNDLEIRQRSRDLVRIIGATPGVRCPAACIARLLARQHPAGSAEALLAYLLHADNEDTCEVLQMALGSIAVHDPRTGPLLRTALQSRETLLRGAAAFALALSREPRQRQAAAAALADPDGFVRLQAAWGLLQAADKAAVPVLIRLLEPGPDALARQAENLLCRLAGPRALMPSVWRASTSRRRCAQSWQRWWREQEPRIDLSKLYLADSPRGLYLVADLDEGQVLALGSDWEERWRLTDLRGPIEAHMLPSGRLLIVENHGERVTERERSGKIVWEKQPSGIPWSCQRLENGNTFIATDTELMEVTPAGKPAWVVKSDYPYLNWARRLEDGRVVMVSTNWQSICYYDSKQTRFGVVAHFDTTYSPRQLLCAVLPTQRFLVYRYFDSIPPGGEPEPDLFEIDETGKECRRLRIYPSAVFPDGPPGFTCLNVHPNGHMLFSQSKPNRILEIDGTGKIVRQRDVIGRPWFVQFVR